MQKQPQRHSEGGRSGGRGVDEIAGRDCEVQIGSYRTVSGCTVQHRECSQEQGDNSVWCRRVLNYQGGHFVNYINVNHRAVHPKLG